MSAPLPPSGWLDLSAHYVLPARPAVELRAFTHGLMPATVPALMAGFAEDWASRGVDAWNAVPDRWDLGRPVGWWSLPEALADRYVAPLLAAPPGTCILQPNVHWTVQCLLSAPEPYAGGRTEIVFSETAFPSVQHSAYQWADILGLTPVAIPARADGFADADRLLEAISDQTAWVFLSHVAFTTGERQPDSVLQALAAKARRHGARFCIDGYHAASTMPVDAPALGCDVYVGGLLKEASGSSGNTFLYVREGVELTPRLSGWFADADPFGFRPEPRPHPDVRRRFLAGTLSIASHYHAVEGLRVLLGAGLDLVRADSLAKTAYAIEQAEAAGLALRSPRDDARRSAMVIFEADAADRLCEFLKTQGVYTDSRQQRFLRFAPWVWNTRADLDQALATIGDALDSGEYRSFDVAQEGPVT